MRNIFMTAVIALALCGGCLILSGCGRSVRKVMYVARSTGSLNTQLGTVIYTDENGKTVTEPHRLLPFSKSFTAREGQPLSISVQGVFPQNRYDAEILLDDDTGSMETACVQRVEGNTQVTECRMTVGVVANDAPRPAPSLLPPGTPFPISQAPDTAATSTPMISNGSPNSLNANASKESAGDLQTAIFSGDIAQIKALLAQGVDVNARDKVGNTALTFAVQLSRSTEAVKLLLNNGADPNLRDTTGETPLILAAFHNRTENIRALLEKGADVNATGSKGFTPLKAALSLGNEESAQVLRAAGGTGG